jgi:hypothetical protein
MRIALASAALHAAQAFESYKRAGVDLLGDHGDDFPPE